MVRLEVITGPMFSGKSEELLRRIRKALYADKKVLIVKPPRDTRDGNKIVCWKKNFATGEFEAYDSMDADIVHSEDEFRDLFIARRPDMIAIDEAQFFDKWLLGSLNNLSNCLSSLSASATGIETSGEFVIIIAGLDMDAGRQPFGVMPQLMAMADYVQKEPAICFKCKGKYGPAIFTQKISGLFDPNQPIQVGKVEYEARCRACFVPPL